MIRMYNFIIKLDMTLKVLFTILTAQISMGIRIPVATPGEKNQACMFYQTKNISSGHEQPDGSWFHEGVSYPLGHFISYNFIKQNDSIISVPPHVRGCYCLQRPCVTSCCEPNKLINWTLESGDGKCRDDDIFFKKVMWNVGKDPSQQVDVLNAFHWRYYRPTCQLFFLSPEYATDIWILMANGSIYMEDFAEIPPDDSYCLGIDLNTKTNRPEVIALKCIEKAEPEVRFTFLPIGMLISVPFLMTTFFVYLLIPELRNVHGKSLMSYVFGLTLAYTLLATVQLYTNNESCRNGGECFNRTLCGTFGYIIYFSFMVSFFWLNVMCFDIFWTFR